MNKPKDHTPLLTFLATCGTLFFLSTPITVHAAPQDSSRFQPIKSTFITPNYPTTETFTTPLTGSLYYHQLIPCPDPVAICPPIISSFTQAGLPEPTNPPTTTYYYYVKNPNTANPDVPFAKRSITKILLSTLTSNTNPEVREGLCPKQCTVTREVTHVPGPSGIPTNRIQSVKEAICPPGYAQVGVYNSQKEIVYQATPPSEPVPIPNLSTFQNYISRGHECIRSSANEFTIKACKVSQFVPSRTTFTTSHPPDPRYIYPDFSASTNDFKYPVEFNGSKGYGVVVFSYSTTGTAGTSGACRTANAFTTDCSKEAFNPNCSLSCTRENDYYDYPLFKQTITCFSTPDVSFSNEITTKYKYIKCTPRAGFTYTDNTVPASIVCARITPTFRKH